MFGVGIMFRLYFRNLNNKVDLLFSNSELAPCLEYIRTNRICLQQCLIITPNNRRVTFNQNNGMMFSEFVAA